MNIEISKEKIIDTACKLGRNILENGGEIYRVEESVNFFFFFYGIVEVQIFTSVDETCRYTQHNSLEILLIGEGCFQECVKEIGIKKVYILTRKIDYLIPL